MTFREVIDAVLNHDGPLMVNSYPYKRSRMALSHHIHMTMRDNNCDWDDECKLSLRMVEGDSVEEGLYLVMGVKHGKNKRRPYTMLKVMQVGWPK